MYHQRKMMEEIRMHQKYIRKMSNKGFFIDEDEGYFVGGKSGSIKHFWDGSKEPETELPHIIRNLRVAEYVR